MIDPKFVELTTSDGLTLPGLLYPVKNSKKAAIMLHGNGSSSVFYDESENKVFAKALNEKGISVLYFNNRGAHLIKKLNVKKGKKVERKRFGMAYEQIKDCVYDIDGAIALLKKLGYTEFYLIGGSTGANKICVYNYFKAKNEVSKYVLMCPGDDTGIYYSLLSKSKFTKLLTEAKTKIQGGKGNEIVKELLPDEVYAYTGLYDTINPDGNYNTFPYYEVLNKVKLSKKERFLEFKSIKKPSLVIMGEQDEYAYGKVREIMQTLKNLKPDFDYKIVKGADHGLTNHEIEVANLIADWM